MKYKVKVGWSVKSRNNQYTIFNGEYDDNDTMYKTWISKTGDRCIKFFDTDANQWRTGTNYSLRKIA